MIPLGDEGRPSITPVVNWLIIASCVVVFLWQTSGGYRFFVYTLYGYGLVPVRVLGGEGVYTLVTGVFLHGSWAHLLGNMLFLWVFGDNIEDSYGHLGYLAFYLFCGVAASALWMLTALGASYPAVGASGAISGVLGAYFVMHPNVRVRTLVSLGYFYRLVSVPAYLMIGLWFVYQLLLALTPIATGVAYWAHVGGFAVGLLVARLFRREEIVTPIPDYDYHR